MPYINLQFRNSTAESVAMHPQLTGSATLVSVVFLQHGENEPLLEFAHCLRVQNVAFVHLQDECFELISHGILFLFEKRPKKAAYCELPSALLSVCLNPFRPATRYVCCCSRRSKSSPW